MTLPPKVEEQVQTREPSQTANVLLMSSRSDQCGMGC